MATHSGTPAWKIPEEPGGLRSTGSWRVGHDWVTSLSLFTFMHWRRKWQPPPVFLPRESQGRGNLVGCRLWGHTESDMTEVTEHSMIHQFHLCVFNWKEWNEDLKEISTFPCSLQHCSQQLRNRQPKCLATNEWRKACNIHTKDYHSDLQKKEILSYVHIHEPWGP